MRLLKEITEKPCHTGDFLKEMSTKKQKVLENDCGRQEWMKIQSNCNSKMCIRILLTIGEIIDLCFNPYAA